VGRLAEATAGGSRTHGVNQLPDAVDPRSVDLLQFRPRFLWQIGRVSTVPGGRRDLDLADRLEPCVAEVLLLWAIRVALALADLQAIAENASDNLIVPCRIKRTSLA